MDKYEEFRAFCKKVRKSERSPRSLMAYWSLEFMDEFDGIHSEGPEVREKESV